MSYVDEGQRSRRGFAAGRSGKGIFRDALYTKARRLWFHNNKYSNFFIKTMHENKY
jgi:hypothetical protein